jgi:hypothetical protein
MLSAHTWLELFRARKMRARAAKIIQSRKHRKQVSSNDKPSEQPLDDAEVSTFFPTFLWVLRDFTLDLVDEVS